MFNRWVGSDAGLWSVPARGGVPQLVAGATKPTELRAFPAFLPDGRHYLYLLGAYGLGVGARRICVASLDGGEPECFASGDSNPAFSATGHVLFVRRGTLVALPFDATRLRASGEAISIARGRSIRQGASTPRRPWLVTRHGQGPAHRRLRRAADDASRRGAT